jgi:hypothetical protein
MIWAGDDHRVDSDAVVVGRDDLDRPPLPGAAVDLDHETAKATSWIDVDRSGEPFTKKLPASNSMSSAEASSRWAAISFALSRSLRRAARSAELQSPCGSACASEPQTVRGSAQAGRPRAGPSRRAARRAW